MSHQQALNKTWQRLLIIFVLILLLAIFLTHFGGELRVPTSAGMRELAHHKRHTKRALPTKQSQASAWRRVQTTSSPR
jgi:hypothetical protein